MNAKKRTEKKKKEKKRKEKKDRRNVLAKTNLEFSWQQGPSSGRYFGGDARSREAKGGGLGSPQGHSIMLAEAP